MPVFKKKLLKDSTASHKRDKKVTNWVWVNVECINLMFLYKTTKMVEYNSCWKLWKCCEIRMTKKCFGWVVHLCLGGHKGIKQHILLLGVIKHRQQHQCNKASAVVYTNQNIFTHTSCPVYIMAIKHFFLVFNIQLRSRNLSHSCTNPDYYLLLNETWTWLRSVFRQWRGKMSCICWLRFLWIL